MRNVCFSLLAAFVIFPAAVTVRGEAPGSSHVKIGGKPCAAEKDPQGDVVRISVSQGIFLPAGGGQNSVECIKLADLQKYGKLKSLSLAGCEVDMTGLSELKCLEHLDLAKARIRNLSSARSDSLKRLDLSGAVPADGDVLTFGTGMKNLRELSLNGLSEKVRIEGLEKLALRRLFLRDCSKSDLSFLRGCRIDELYMDKPYYAIARVNLKYLEGLPLKVLHLGRLVRVKNTGSLRTLPQLSDLDISLYGNPDFTFETLCKLPLKRLKLWHYTVIFSREEAVFLSRLPLNELHLFTIIFADIRPILQMPLHTLSLRQLALPADTLKILAKNTSLRRLALAHPMKPDGSGFLDFPWEDMALLNISELDLSSGSIPGGLDWIGNMSNLEVLILPGQRPNRKPLDLRPLTGMSFRQLVMPGVTPEEKSKIMRRYRIRETL